MHDSFLAKIRTIEDRDYLLSEINLLKDSLYTDKGFGFESVLRNKIRSWVSDYLIELFSSQNSEREEILDYLEKELNNLKEFGLRLAFEPSSDAIDRFLGLIRGFSGKNLILNISIDPNLIGGAQMVFEGKYKDFTFKKIFEKEFEENRTEMIKMLSEKFDKKTVAGQQENM